MDEPTKRNLIEMLQDKTALALSANPHGQAIALNKRLNQLEGMLELLTHLPECQCLTEPLEQHYEWLKKKKRAWPI